MGAVQHRICPLCGKSSGERFRDEELPCQYCGGDVRIANKILKQGDRDLVIFKIFIILSIMLYILIILEV